MKETSTKDRQAALAALMVRLLRARRGWSQKELSRRSGVHCRLISTYEAEGDVPSPTQLARLAGAAELPVAFLESLARAVFDLEATGLLRAGVFALPKTGKRPRGKTPVSRSAAAGTLAEDLGRRTAAAMTPRLAAAPWEPQTPAGAPFAPGEADRAAARALWERLAAQPAEMRPLLIRTSSVFRSRVAWALAERACDESERATPGSPSDAVELAKLALALVDAAPVAESFRNRLRGYVGFFLANAHRAANDLTRASDVVEISRANFEREEGSDAGLLSSSRVLSLEASIRRDQRRFADSLDLLDGALRTEPEPARRGDLLLKKAFTFEQMGEPELAVAALREAAPLVDSGAELRARCVLRFNLATNLLHLNRATEAAELLPEVRALADELGHAVDRLRVDWLTAWIDAESGQSRKALACYAEVRRAFTAKGLKLDAALVGLDEAALLLAAGRCAEVRQLAQEVRQIFTSEELHGEALAALRLFLDAVAQEVANVSLAKSASATLSGRGAGRVN